MSVFAFVRPKRHNRQMHLQLLDLDDSLTAQSSLHDAAPWDSVRTLDLRDLGPRLRLWSRAKTIGLLRQRLSDAGDLPGPCITLMGSGDFHHLTTLLMARARQPFTLIHFDNHPDWVRLAPRWHCGSWINQALKLANVAKIITLGVCSDDLVRPDLKGGNLPALERGALDLYPWNHAPSKVWRRVIDGPGRHFSAGHIHWQNLVETDLDQQLAAIIRQIPTETIWITIDKDVLAEEEVVTNWDQGQMRLPALLRMIELIGGARRILGADICGEYAAPNFSNALKRLEVRMDQPERGDVAAMLKQNESVNRLLLSTIESAAGSR